MKTTLRLAPLALLIGCASPSAFASFDFVCSPTWAIAGDQLMGCSNLPFLSPGNDSRANLQLLLADAGRLRLPETLKSTSGYEDGYAQVPFTLEMLDPAVAEAAEREKASEGQENDTETEQEDPRKENLSLALEQLGVELGETDLAEHYFAEGEGNRCRSNDFDSAHAFVDQLAGTEALSAGADKVKYFEGTPIPTSVVLVGVLAYAASKGALGANVWGGAWTLGPWQLHPLVLLFALSGTLMISKTLRIPKF